MNSIAHLADDRGQAEHGWLHTRFSFSFADWYDPSRMGFGVLRVINDDVIDPDSGFDLHPHNNMEIITIVMEGVITHGDSMGNTAEVVAGDVQVMSAGTGVVHSEHNNSLTETLKLFQIWILPNKRNVIPRYDQKSFGTDCQINTLQLLVSPDGRDNSLMIHQDAFVLRGQLSATKTQTYTLKNSSQNGVYLFVIEGTIAIDTHTLNTRDAIAIEDAAAEISFVAHSDATYLLFEVPLENV